MFPIGAALAATPTPAELAAHQQALVEAHRSFDHEALQALFTEKGRGANQILLTQSEQFWLDTARYHESCKTGPVEVVGPDHVRVPMECLGSTLQVSYHLLDGTWLRGTEGGSYKGSYELMDLQDGWTVPGRPVGPLPGSQVPALPLQIELSPVFVSRKKHMDDGRFAALGTLPGGCGPVEALLKDATGGTQWGQTTVEKPIGDAHAGPFIRYRTVADGACAVLVSWAPPEGVRLPFPYACQTAHCRTLRGEPLEMPDPSITVEEKGAKREKLAWVPVPGSSATRTVYAARTLEIDIEKGGLARLLPKLDRATTAPRALEYRTVTTVTPDGSIDVADSELKVTKVDDALREDVEALEAKQSGLRWAGLVVKGGTVEPTHSFSCTAAIPPSLPTEPVGPGATWTVVTIELPFDAYQPATRHHRLVSVTDTTLAFESTVETRIHNPGSLDYLCEASGKYSVDRATLAMSGDFQSVVTFEGREEGAGMELSAKGRLVERMTVTR